MGLLGRLRGKEKIKFPSGRDVEKAEDRQERAEWKQQQKEAYRKAYREARLERMKQQGSRAGSTTLGDRLSKLASPPMSSLPSKNRTTRPSMRTYSTRNNYNPFGSSFDTGMNYNAKPKKKTSSTRYAVVGGKAYPVANTSKKKKKNKKKSTSGFNFSNFDMTDNYGFMKK